MKSFQTLYNEISTKTGEDSAAQLSTFKSDIVSTDALVLSEYRWPFLETIKTFTTVPAQNNYNIANSLQRVTSVVCIVGSVQYRPKAVESVKMWEYLQSLRVATSSNVTQFFFRQGNQILLWPTPQSAFIVNVRGRKATRALSLDDYTTGTITTATNGATGIVASGTSWGAGSIGNFIRINYTAGDFNWYEIGSITSTTGLSLVDNYEGTSIVGGSASYTIGEFSNIPGEFHDLLVSRPMALYYQSIENEAMAKAWWMRYDGGKEAGLIRDDQFAGGMYGQMIDRYSESFEGVWMEEQQPKDPSTADLLIKNFGYSGEGW